MYTNKKTWLKILLYFDIDEIFNSYITIHNENWGFYLVKFDFKLFSEGEL